MTMSNEHLYYVLDALKALLPDHTYHYWASGEHSRKYICFMETGEVNSLWSNNRRELRALEATVDFFTKDEFDPLFDRIEDALMNIGCGIRLNSVQFEEDTGYIHYEWNIQIYG